MEERHSPEEVAVEGSPPGSSLPASELAARAAQNAAAEISSRAEDARSFSEPVAPVAERGGPEAPTAPLPDMTGALSLAPAAPPAAATPSLLAASPPAYLYPEAGAAEAESLADQPGALDIPVAVAAPWPAEAAPLALGRPTLRETLTRPLGRWTAVLLFGSALLAMAAAALLGLAVSHGEWATGARAAGLAGLVSCGAYLLGMLVRLGAGRRTAPAMLLGLLAALVLGLAGDAGLWLINPLHVAQARAFETSHAWDMALREYAASGEHGPASRDLARIDVEWGDTLLSQSQYAPALDRYLTVISVYPQVPVETLRAVHGLLVAYAAWLSTDASDLPYPGILAQLAQDRQASWCNAACRDAVGLLQAGARYQYGVALAQAKQYGQATVQFDTVTTQFATSPFAARAHAAAATAYYAIGQAQQAGPACTDAIPIYQKLATEYSDTPEGASAKQALAAPEDVTGTLQGYPTNPAPAMYLSHYVFQSTYFSDDYSAGLGASGQFTFKQVAQGSYNLSAAFANGSGVRWYDAQTGNEYNIVVGPLCTLQLPTYSWS